MNKDNKEMIPWYFTVVFFGEAVFNTFMWIDAADAKDAFEKSLAACQQENRDLKGKVAASEKAHKDRIFQKNDELAACTKSLTVCSKAHAECRDDGKKDKCWNQTVIGDGRRTKMRCCEAAWSCTQLLSEIDGIIKGHTKEAPR